MQTSINSLKTKCVYGINLSSEEAMRFEKYMANNNIAMNTKSAEQRKAIAIDWLKKRTTPASTSQSDQPTSF